MNRLNKSIHINPTFSWIDWGLYEDVGAAVTVASRMNLRLAELVNRGNGRQYVYRDMMKLMDFYESNGASDSKPVALLNRVLNEVFGE